MYPILFEFGYVTVYSLWFFVTVGFVTGALLFSHIAKRNRIRMMLVTDNALFIFAMSLVCSRLFFVITHTELYFYSISFSKLFGLFALWDKGLSFWGAITGLVLSIFYIGRKTEESVGRIFDALLPGVLLGTMWGNFGAFLDGINYGTPSNLPWAMVFRSANVKYISPIHPTQLYAIVATGLILLLLIKLLGELRGRLPGFVAELGLTLMSFSLFLVEFIRGDETIKLGSVRVSQILAFVGVVIGVYLIHMRYTNKRGGDSDHILRTFVQGLPLFKKRGSKAHQEQTSLAPSQSTDTLPVTLQ